MAREVMSSLTWSLAGSAVGSAFVVTATIYLTHTAFDLPMGLALLAGAWAFIAIVLASWVGIRHVQRCRNARWLED